MSPRISSKNQRVTIFTAVRDRLPKTIGVINLHHPFMLLSVRVAAILGVFVGFRWFLFNVARLPIESYASPSLVLGLGQAIGTVGLILIGVLFVAPVLGGGLFPRWDEFEDGKMLRLFIVILAAGVAWPLSTYGYNYYFDQGHYYDRALIVLLIPLLYYRPIAVYPFLAISFVAMWQFGEPDLAAASVFPHKLQILNVLIMFGATLLLHSITGSRRKDEFLFLTICLVAASYWLPALTKLELNWVMHGGLYKMLPAAYAHGWLSFLEPQTIVNITKVIAIFDWPMRVFVIGIEVACLLLLFRREVSITLLITVIVFHIGVFAIYGYLFWTWILVDAALLILLVRDYKARQIAIYSSNHLLIFVVLVVSASTWCSPAKLGWYDTRLAYTFRYFVVGISGKEYTVSPRFIEPYSDVFTMASFKYLVSSHRGLVNPYGIAGLDSAIRLRNARTADEVFTIEREVGRPVYDSARSKRFYEFLQRYFSNRNARGNAAEFLQRIAPPPQFWSYATGNVYTGQEQVSKLIVNEVTTLYDESDILTIRNIELARLDISTDAESNSGAIRTE